MVSLILVRNTMGFAIGYGYLLQWFCLCLFYMLTYLSITPWVDNMGYQNWFISAAMVGFVCSLTLLIMIKFGKRLRENTAQIYWKLVHMSAGTNVAS